MARKRKSHKIPKSYVPIETEHCAIAQVVDAIYFNIQTSWMTEAEFDEIYQKVKEKLKNATSPQG